MPTKSDQNINNGVTQTMKIKLRSKFNNQSFIVNQLKQLTMQNPTNFKTQSFL